jgi:hypothetical protein
MSMSSEAISFSKANGYWNPLMITAHQSLEINQKSIIHISAPQILDPEQTCNINFEEFFNDYISSVTIILELKNPEIKKSISIKSLETILCHPKINCLIFITDNPFLKSCINLLKLTHNADWIILNDISELDPNLGISKRIIS